MEQDIFYYTPDRPMFIFRKTSSWIARVRVIRYVDGKIDSVLEDSLGWMTNIDRFQKIDNSKIIGPFYGIYKEGHRIILGDMDGSIVNAFIPEHNKEDWDEFFQSIKRVGCPFVCDQEELNRLTFR